MIVAYTSDLHGGKELYDSFFLKAKSVNAELILLGGDVGPKAAGSAERLVQVQSVFWDDYLLPAMRKALCPVGFIFGNDDARILEAQILEKLPSNGYYLHKKIQKIGSVYVGGFAFVNRLPFRFKDWEKPEVPGEPAMTDPKFDIRTLPAEHGSLQDDLQGMESIPHCKEAIWVIHVPPFNTPLDVISDFSHVGSKVVRRFIERNQPAVTLHGHIHESPKMSGTYVTKIDNTLCFNVGSNDKQGWMLVLDTKTLSHKRIALHEV